MLNLSSPSDQILKEVTEERERAFYWHNKVHSKKLVHKQIMASYKRAWDKKHGTYTGFNSEYVSSSGNKWYTFELISPRPNNPEKFQVQFCTFIYYETAASIGCFLMADDDPKNGGGDIVYVFTSHFFQRYCERLGIQYGSTEMLTDFVCDIRSISSSKITDTHGEHEVIRIPHRGVGMVIARKDNPAVLEVKTFLADDNLNPNKKKELKTLTEYGDSVISKPKREVVETVLLKY